jgi:hypothetical protein
VIIF